MFSKISQLGKTFADEINRINDEVNNTSTGQNQIADSIVAKKIIATSTPEVEDLDKPQDLQKDEESEEDAVIGAPANADLTSQIGAVSKPESSLTEERLVPGTSVKYSSLPPEICLKINKFLKYEKKYPQLYDAYKIEKKKSALIRAFENMLKEKTPCSSIGELNAVRDYLTSLESKGDILNQELSKLTKEKRDRDEQIKKLQTKVSDLQKALTTKNAVAINAKKELEQQMEQLKEEIQKLKENQKLNDTVILENEQLKKENAELHDRISQLKDFTTDTEENKTLKKEIEDWKQKLDASIEDNAKLSDRVTSFATERFELEKQSTANLTKVETENSSLKDKIQELEKSLESAKKLNDLFRQKIDNLSKPAPEPASAPTAIPGSTKEPATKLKNKKKKGKKPQQQNQTPQSSENANNINLETQTVFANKNDIELIELKHKLEEAETKYTEEATKSNGLQKELQLKAYEIEDLKDMLRDVGDSLVESQKGNKERTDLMKKLENTQRDLECRKNDLEMLRVQNSNALKDYEQTKMSLSKKIEDSNNSVQEVKTLLENKETEMKKLESSNRDMKSKLIDLEKLLSKMKEAEGNYKAQIKKLYEEQDRLISEVSNLKSVSQDSSLTKNELENLKVQLSRKERILNEAENKIKFLQEEKTKINDSMIELKVQNKEFALHEKSYKESTEKLTALNEKLKAQVNDNTLKINRLSLENTKLVKELEEVTDQYNEVKHVKSSSNDQVETMRKRVDELTMRNKEYENRVDLIQEELTQSRNMLQERAKEMSTLRKLMMENDESRDTERRELKSRIDRLTEEKEKLDNDSLSNIKRKQKEVDELKRKQDELITEVDALKEEKKLLSSKINDLESSLSSKLPTTIAHLDNSSEYTDKIIDSLRESLSNTEKRLKELEDMNSKLRTANQESSDKLVYLNRKYKLLSQQFRKNSMSTSRNNSGVGLAERKMSTSSLISESAENLLHPEIQNPELSVEEDKEDVKEKSIYIKNVLMGYLEHKEQRQMLLPVIKTLLFMSDDESEKMTQLLV